MAAAIGAAAVGGGLSISGGIGEAMGAAHAATRATRRARQAFQNRYTWTMQDLRNAGLNPILAGEVGGGSAAQVSAQQHFPNVMEGAAATARGLPAMMEQIRNMRAERTKMEADTKLAGSLEFQSRATADREFSQTALNDEMRRKTRVDAELSAATAKSVDVNRELSATGLPGARAQQRLDESKPGEYLRWLNRAVRAITGRDSTSAR